MSNISIADKFDIPTLLRFMNHYADVSPIYELRVNRNPQHVENLLTEIIYGRGIIFISRTGAVPTGMLIALRNGNVWNPDVVLMNELAFWIEPEYRGGLGAARLLQTYKKYCEAEQLAGNITGWTISKLVNSEINSYERLGCSMLEETWIGVQ